MARTIALVLAVNLFVIVLGTVTLRQSRDQYLRNAATQGRNLTQTLVYSISGVFDAADIALLSVVDEAERQHRQGGISTDALNAFIIAQHTRVPALDSIRMADGKGNILYGTGVDRGSNKSVQERDYFIKLRDNPQAALVISKPVLGLISGKWVVILARRVSGPNGAFAGVVYCAIPLEKIRNMLSTIDVGARGRITLRDESLGLILRYPQQLPVSTDVGRKPASSEMQKRIAKGMSTDTYYAERTNDGTPRLVSYSKVGRYPMYISIALLPDEILARWYRELAQILALVVLFLLVTSAMSRVIYLRLLRQEQAEEEQRRAREELEVRVAERTEAQRLTNEQLKLELAVRERAEVELRRGRNMLAQIINTIPQFVFWKDRDSIYQGCNIVFAKAAGLDDPELIAGKSDYDLPWLREESNAYRSDDRAVMEGNRPKYHIIEQQLQASGRHLWVDTTKVPLCDDTGTVTGILGVYDNITERKMIEEARDRALAMLESLLASSPTAILVYEGESGACVKANQAAADLAGGTVQQLLSQNFREVPSWEAGMRAAAELVLSDGQTRSIEISTTSSFGKLLQVECFLSRFDVEGKHHLMFIAVDMTERKRLEQEKRLIESQMLHVQKLESLGVLAGGIAHDFNNILMVILGNADLALMRMAPDSPASENLAQIEQAASRAADLARQMLAYSGRGKFVIEKLDMTRLVQEMGQMLEVSISKKVILRYDFAPGLPPVSGDATQLRQVVLNLVLNASEAVGDANGMIVISTKRLFCDRAYLSESWIDDRLPEGDYVVLEVSDNGCGMAREVIPRIFDPFFTTKFTGRGLGMAAVLGIVRAHHGAIKVYSEKGRGSTFRLLLPCVEGYADHHEAADPGPLWRGSGTVLLADDEESIRGLGRDMLETMGFDVLLACDGQEALEVYRRHKEEIVCVLLDLTMPHLDGEQTFRALRELQPDVKVVISSGYNEQEVTMKFVGAGPSGFIQKPYRVNEMSRTLRGVLGE
ncbi:PAS domain-containing protein [Geomonas edaphica]|uniref:PAS domain-containing protein n=1 Tax=Geomonas edaphica TaxID=2570226 RepID=UPI001FE62E38|nr:PAS domain-containing protein [Geomonas edaphica]